MAPSGVDGVLRRPAIVLVLAVVVRLAAWHALHDTEWNTYLLRAATASVDEDMLQVQDVMAGRSVGRWNALWAVLKAVSAGAGLSAPAVLCVFSIVVDLLVGCALQAGAELPAYWYLLNPAVVVSCPLSVANVQVLLVVTGLVLFPTRRRYFAAAVLGLSGYFAPVAALTMGCVCLLTLESFAQRVVVVGAFTAALVATALLGYLHGDDEFLVPSFGTCVMPRPNWGLHWYLHLEVFPSFRLLFCRLLVLFTPGIVLPYAIKLLSERGNTRMALATGHALCVVTSLCPTLAAYSAALPLLYAASPASLATMNVPPRVFVWALALCFALHFGFGVAWLQHQSANSNFFYFVNLAWGLAMASAVIEFATTHAKAQRAANAASGKAKTD